MFPAAGADCAAGLGQSQAISVVLCVQQLAGVARLGVPAGVGLAAGGGGDTVLCL